MSKHWIAVASAEHVRRGRVDGYMQVCHGKAAPLRRIHPGDHVVYYSPTENFGGKDKLRTFTAIGVVQDVAPYSFDLGGGFHPYRRDVQWLSSREVPITPMLGLLEFSSGNRNWGYQLRFGLFEISAHDMQVIAAAMEAEVFAGVILMELEKNEKLLATQPISQRGVIVLGIGRGGKAQEVLLSASSLAIHIGKRARKGKALEAKLKASGLVANK